MTLELNKPYFVKRVAEKGGTLNFIPFEGFCGDVAIGKPYLAQRVAEQSGVLHFLMSDQKLDDAGRMIIGKPYLANRVAEKNGKLHFLVNGKKCGCELCSLRDWSDPSDPATLTMSVHSPSGGFADFAIPMVRNDSAPGFGYGDVLSEVSWAVFKGTFPALFLTNNIWTSCDFTVPTNTNQIIRRVSYTGNIDIYYGSSQSGAFFYCPYTYGDSSVATTGLTKFRVAATLSNYICYQGTGSPYLGTCYIWALSIAVYDRTDLSNEQLYLMQAETYSVAPSVLPVNLIEYAGTSPYFFGSGDIVCILHNPTLDGNYHWGQSRSPNPVEGTTFEVTVT